MNSYEDYTVALVYALPLEKAVDKATLDNIYLNLQQVQKTATTTRKAKLDNTMSLSSACRLRMRNNSSNYSDNAWSTQSRYWDNITRSELSMLNLPTPSSELANFQHAPGQDRTYSTTERRATAAPSSQSRGRETDTIKTRSKSRAAVSRISNKRLRANGPEPPVISDEVISQGDAEDLPATSLTPAGQPPA
ncbi:hypothetical protein BBP40_007348 [Aspergillus hancockii]|nr:hypothetical protein BBP40_007348 [Aspergillus hancockii]